MKMNPGTYYAHPSSGKMDTIGDNVTPLMRVTMRITHFAHEGAWSPLQDSAERDLKLFCSDKAWPYTQKKLEALGFNGNFDAPVFSQDGLSLTCIHNEQGYEDWDLMYEGTHEIAPPSKDVVRKLDAKWRQSHGNSAVPPGAPGTPPTTPPATPPVVETIGEPAGNPPGGDIPF